MTELRVRTPVPRNRRFRRLTVALAAVLLVTGAPSAVDAGLATTGLANPEDLHWDAPRQRWIVSNLGPGEPSPTNKDRNGFLSLLGPDGSVRRLRWVRGLDAPKGMGQSRGRLYVADIDRLVVIDMATGRVSERISVPGAEFLNGVTVDGSGNVYVADTMTNTVWVLGADRRPRKFVESDLLESPNGLAAVGDQLFIASSGPNLSPATFMPERPGRVLRINLRRPQEIVPLTDRLGSLDGIEPDGKDLLVTDFFSGRLLRVRPDGGASEVLRVAPSAADLGWDPARRVVGVPVIFAQSVVYSRLAPNGG